MMLAAVQDYRRIWDVAAVRRSPRMFKFLTGLLLLLLAGSLVLDLTGDAVGLPAHFGLAGTGHVLLACAGAELDLVWSTVFMPGSLLLHSAVNARLLPRQRRRLRQMAVGGWVLANAGLALGVGEPAIFPLAALWSLSMGLAAAGQGWASTVSIVLPLSLSQMMVLLPQPFIDALRSPTGAAVASTLVLALGWRLLSAQYGDGGDRLLQRSEALARQLQRFESKGEVRETPMLSWGFRLMYLPALRRACGRRDPSALLMHALGPFGHWSMVAAMLVMVAPTVVLIVAMPVLAGSARTQPVLGRIVESALVVLPLLPLAVAFCTLSLRHQIGKRQGEQALLRLTPLAGNAALLNHRLADGLLKAGARHWLILSVPFCLLALAFGGAEGLARELALCCLGGQLALAAVLDDFSRSSPRSWYWKMTALAAAEMVVTVGLGAWLGYSGWPWLAALVVAAGGMQVVRGWRRLHSALPAFPALRFDTPTEPAR